MSLHPAEIAPVPASTMQVAKAAFPKGCPAMRMRDELGTIYDDQMFAAVYPARGQPAHPPWRLALVTVLQVAESLPNRQAVNAVQGRIDWKYALGLELADPGFDYSILCEFRARLIASGVEQILLDAMLARFRELGLLKARERQRTVSTHVLTAVRAVNRLDSVGETLRAALNALAAAAPDWLARHADAEWPDRYGRAFEEWRLPKGEAPCKALGEVIGTDGHRLLAAAYGPSAPPWLRDLPTVLILHRAWVSQFYVEADRVTWRDRTDLPPASLGFGSPYNPDAQFGNKHSTTSSGYKVYFTDTWDEDRPHLLVHIEMSPAPVSDVAMSAPMYEAPRAKNLLPEVDFMDADYINADLPVDTKVEHGSELIGPVRPDTSWQAKAGEGHDISASQIDCESWAVTCPQGHKDVDWLVNHDAWGTGIVHVSFEDRTCRVCPSRPFCTRAKKVPRELTLRRARRHEAIQAAQGRQDTPEWRALYGARARIEGCLSQGVRVCGLRRLCYVDLAKTHLQHVAIAATLDVERLSAWVQGESRAATRISRLVRLMAA